MAAYGPVEQAERLRAELEEPAPEAELR